MILIDSNIPMYIVGVAQSKKVDAQLLVEQAVARGDRLVTDAEALQEILHRYAAIERRDAIAAALKTLLGIVDEVFPIDRETVLRAAEIVQGAAFSARDAVHIAVMERHRVPRIMSYDRDFDRWPGITRIGST